MLGLTVPTAMPLWTELDYEKINEYRPYRANPVKTYLVTVHDQQPVGVSQARGY